MNGRRLLLFVMLCASCLPALAQNSRRDGNWWRQRSEGERAGYMLGFFDGITLGYHFSFWGLEDKSGKLDVAMSNKVGDSYDLMIGRYTKGVDNLQISDGLTKFYEDYRNRTILISDGVWLVLNAISGKSEPEMETLTENYRKHTK